MIGYPRSDLEAVIGARFPRFGRTFDTLEEDIFLGTVTFFEGLPYLHNCG
jgi:hypothetical protein